MGEFGHRGEDAHFTLDEQGEIAQRLSVGLLIALFALGALFYSSVGFGGGSSYTALLVWKGESPEMIRLVSLSCNLVVVLIGGWATLRARSVRFKLLFPLLVSSIPGVYTGVGISLPRDLFFGILGSALVLAGALLLFQVRAKEVRNCSFALLMPIGFLLGLLAGITGIGGGIYLVPVLHFLGAGKVREVAAVGTWFILINSGVGLILLPSYSGLGEYLLLPPAVALGGLIGSRLLHGFFSELHVRRWTGVLIIFVGVRVLFF